MRVHNWLTVRDISLLGFRKTETVGSLKWRTLVKNSTAGWRIVAYRCKCRARLVSETKQERARDSPAPCLKNHSVSDSESVSDSAGTKFSPK